MRYTFKVIIAGDGGVGKTTLVNRYVSGTFKEDSRITLGVQFMVKRLNVNGDAVDLQIWDFGGEERFRFILSGYCRGAHGAIFMYDITNPASLYHIDEWMIVLRSQNGRFPVIIGGTKDDLNFARKVGIPEAMQVAGKYGISEAMEVSSKTGHNVELLFQEICHQMIQQTARKGSATPEVKPVDNITKNTGFPLTKNEIELPNHQVTSSTSPIAAAAAAPQNGVVPVVNNEFVFTNHRVTSRASPNTDSADGLQTVKKVS